MLLVATGQHIDEAFLLMLIAEVKPMTMNQRQLRREREAKGFSLDRAGLNLPAFNSPAFLFNRVRVRGKKTPAAAGVRRVPAASAGCPSRAINSRLLYP